MDVHDARTRSQRLLCLVTLAGVMGGLAGCAHYIGTTAGSFMRKADESDDPNVRNLAYTKLADPDCYTSDEQKVQAVAMLAAKLAAGTEPVASRAQICRTLGMLEMPEARDAVARAIEDPEPIVRAEAARALAKVGGPSDAAILGRVMAADQDTTCRMAAIEGLGSMKSDDPRLVEQLADGMEHADPAIRLASYRAVKSLTGKDLGPEAKTWRESVGGADVMVPAASAVAGGAPAEPLRR